MTTYSNFTDDEMIVQLKSDDQGAWRFVYQQYKPMVATYISQNSGQKVDAEDLYHEILADLKLFIMKGKTKDRGNNLKNLIYTFMLNTWRYRLRERKKDPQLAEMPGHEMVEEAARAFADWSKVEAALKVLKTQCQELILLRHLNKIPLAEIAQEQGYSDARSAKTALNRCMDKLREMVKEHLKDN